MLVGQQALVELYIIFALQKTHIFGEYVIKSIIVTLYLI